jgi:phosphoglycerate dehydrogenase-like enzyme
VTAGRTLPHPRYRSAMRLLLDAEIQDDTVAELRGLDPGLDVVDVRGEPGFDMEAVEDREVEVIVGPSAPSDLDQVPKLRWLQLRSAGVDHLASDPPWRHGIVTTNARGVYAIPIAEYVTGMVLRSRQPTGWADDQAAHHWPEDAPLITILRGATALVVGYGSIGREIARQLTALGVRILAAKARPDKRADDGYRVPGTGDPDGSIPERMEGLDRLVDLAGIADLLIVTVPLTDDSRGLIDRQVIAALPAHAWLLNISRGPLVDEPALLDALRGGRLGGAVLDVFAEEPLPPDSPWWDAPNTVVTPHASGVTLRYFDRLVIENVRRYLASEPLLNQVDPERGY